MHNMSAKNVTITTDTTINTTFPTTSHINKLSSQTRMKILRIGTNMCYTNIKKYNVLEINKYLEKVVLVGCQTTLSVQIKSVLLLYHHAR